MATAEAGKAQSTQYKRKLTEARREQNRRAQQLWRQRQKQRRVQETSARVLAELSKSENALVQSESPEIAKPVSTPIDAFAFDNQDYLRQIATDDFAQSDTVYSSLDPMGTGLIEQPFLDDVFQQAIPEPQMPLPVALYYYVPPDPSAEDMRYLWDVEEDIGQKIYFKPLSHRKRNQMDRMSTNLLPPTQASSTFLDTPPLWQSPSLSDESSHGSSSGQVLPSPYLNHIQLVGESCFGATLSIVRCLGIPRASYINDHPSPFTSSSNADIHKLPVDLRPSGYQLILPHPCYLDCIPFPHFRSMAVYLSSLKKLDHCSLFLDLMHDGMECWGSTRANARHGRSMRDGVAWSKRSWEAKRWFWKKWGWIARITAEDIENGNIFPTETPDDEELDDPDGMLSGSRWWWAQQAVDDQPDFAPVLDSGSAVGNISEGEELGSFLSRMRTCNVGIRLSHEVVPWD